MSQSCRKPHEGGCKQGITSMCGGKGEGRVAVVNLWPSWLKTAVLLSSFWAWTKDNLIRLINKIIERDKNWVFAKELVKSQNIPVSNSLYQLQLSYLRFHREQTLHTFISTSTSACLWIVFFDHTIQWPCLISIRGNDMRNEKWFVSHRDTICRSRVISFPSDSLWLELVAICQFHATHLPSWLGGQGQK